MLLDIYPARELPIEGITSDIIFEKVSIADKKIYHKDQVMTALATLDLDIVCTIGAGDIDQLIEPINAMLAKK